MFDIDKYPQYYNADYLRYNQRRKKGLCTKCGLPVTEKKKSGEAYALCLSCREKQAARNHAILSADPDRSQPRHINQIYTAINSERGLVVGSADAVGQKINKSAQWIRFMARSGKPSRDGWSISRRAKEGNDESKDPDALQQGETAKGN